MKKIFTILCLMALTMGAQAGVVTNRASAGSPMTFDQFKALSGTGKHFAIVGSSSNTGFCYPNWFGFNANFAGTLTSAYLFDLVDSSTGSGWYNIKRVSDNLYVSAEGGNFHASTKIGFRLVNRRADDYAPELSDASLHISLDNAAGNHYNCNTSNLGFRGGTGGYSTYVAYGPFNTDVTIKYLNSANNEEIQATENGIMLSGTVEAPEIVGYTIQGSSSATIDTDGQVITFLYDEAASFDYTLVVNGAPDGTTITIKGEPASAGAVSFDAAVSESDVVVTLPSEYSYLQAKVTISGTTITIDCEDTRWPINFSKDQKYTRTDRFIQNVRIGSKVFTITNDGLNTPAYRDFTSDVLVVPAGATLVPAIGYQGGWMHGFFYVDLDNDGQFYVANPNHQTAANTEYNGELLSYANEGNALNANKQEMPAFVMPTTPGDYRARFKVDWVSTDPGGNPGADVNDVTSANHIIANGGTIVDITLRILAPVEVTYIVVDGDNNELTRGTEIDVPGETITTLPAALQRPMFYTYSTINETVSEDNKVFTFTATPKADAPFKYADSFDNISQWYNMRIQANETHYMYDNNGSLSFEGTCGENEYAWGFVGTPYDGFQVYNYTAGGADALDNNVPSGLSASGTSVKFQVTNSAAGNYGENAYSYFALYVDAGNYLNYQAGAIQRWNNNDAGSTFMLDEATIVTDEDRFNRIITLLETYPYGTGLNQYSLTLNSEDKTAQAGSLISDLKAAGYTAENYTQAQAIQAGTSLNMPQAKTFLRIKSAATEKYISSTVDSSQSDKYKTYYLGVENADNTTIWFYDGTHLLNYATGLYTNNCSAADLGATGTEFAFSEAPGVLGKYNIKPGSQNYWYAGNPTIDNYSDNTHANTRFTLEYVNELPITLRRVSEKTPYFATFSAPVAVEINGATLCSVEVSESGKSINYTATTDTQLAAENGVLLTGESGSATATIITETVETVDYGLEGYSAAFAVSDNTKLFLGKGKDSGKVGFYALGSAKTNGFKAYFVNSTSGGEAKEGFDLVDANETTGVESIDNAQFAIDNAPVYNLQGQRVNKAQKGVFIQNGKKVVVK